MSIEAGMAKEQRQFDSRKQEILKRAKFLDEAVIKIHTAFEPVIKSGTPMKEDAVLNKSIRGVSCAYEEFLCLIEDSINNAISKLNDYADRSAV